MVRRFDLDLEGGKPSMEEDEHGAWVRVSDYDRLATLARSLAEQVKEVAGWDNNIPNDLFMKAEMVIHEIEYPELGEVPCPPK